MDNISGQTEFFQYDRLDRLKEWSVHAGVYDASTPQANDQPIEFDALQYDNIGNIIAKHSVGALTYDPQIRPHAVQFDGQFTYEYEANGNLIQGGGRSYVYDGFDLPTSIEHEGTITDFVYGANLRRVKKTVNDLEVTRYMGQLFEEREVTSAGQTQRTAIYHIHAPDGLIGQGQIDDDGNMSVKYLATDHLGSVTAQWDSDGNLEHRYSYTPFGERRHSAMGPFSSAPTDGFTGHEHDDSTGLINMVFRQYDPRTAQFVTPDPLLGSPFDPARLNPYTYAHHNPMRWVDPLGLQDGSIGSLDVTISNDMYVNPGEDRTPIKKPTKPRRSAKSSRRTDKDVDDSSMENVLDGVQTTLDVVGLIPGLGEIADGTNALIYVGRGKYTDAALSVAAMVPFAGWFATGGKIGKKIIKYADDGVDAVADGTRAYKSQKAAQAAREHTQYIGCVGGTCRNGGCFVEGTPVATPEGSVSIEDVQVGDEVLCASQDQLEWLTCTVSQTFVRPYQGDMITLEAGEDRIVATGDHPFFVRSGHQLAMRPLAHEAGPDAYRDNGYGRWVNARSLRVGDVLVLVDGQLTQVQAVSKGWASVPVFNLNVHQHMTYAVGHAGILVHNYPQSRPIRSATTNRLVTKPREVALGLDPYYKKLSESTGAARYREWSDVGLTRRTVDRHFGRAFHQAVKNADAVHFDTQGMNDLFQAIQKGAAGFNSKSRNMTNAELHHIVNNPDILNKT